MSLKLRVDKDKNYVTFELSSSTQTILVSIYDRSNSIVLFESVIPFGNMKKQYVEICSSWQLFCNVLKQIAENKPEDIDVDDEFGVVKVKYQIQVFGNCVEREVVFSLEKQIKPLEEMTILRQKVNLYEDEIAQLKKEMMKLKIQNLEVHTRLNYIEQIIKVKDIDNNEKKYEKRVEKVENRKQKQEEGKHIVSSVVEKIQEKGCKQEHYQLSLDPDPACIHFDKFIVDKNRIQSLHEDYYQVHWKNPLPEKGSVKVALKMTGKNHCSIGIITESQLKNQYSFQNKKSVCLYTYYNGFFRGLYVKKEYIPLNWGMELNQIVYFDINLTDGIMQISLEKQKEAEEIDFKDLQKEPLYFFLEMYEKENSLQFL